MDKKRIYAQNEVTRYSTFFWTCKNPGLCFWYLYMSWVFMRQIGLVMGLWPESLISRITIVLSKLKVRSWEVHQCWNGLIMISCYVHIDILRRLRLRLHHPSAFQFCDTSRAPKLVSWDLLRSFVFFDSIWKEERALVAGPYPIETATNESQKINLIPLFLCLCQYGKGWVGALLRFKSCNYLLEEFCFIRSLFLMIDIIELKHRYFATFTILVYE